MNDIDGAVIYVMNNGYNHKPARVILDAIWSRFYLSVNIDSLRKRLNFLEKNGCIRRNKLLSHKTRIVWELVNEQIQ